MLEFDVDKFMAALQKRLPNATLSCRTRTPEERAIMLENLKAINSRKSHAPALGHGALQK